MKTESIIQIINDLNRKIKVKILNILFKKEIEYLQNSRLHYINPKSKDISFGLGIQHALSILYLY